MSTFTVQIDDSYRSKILLAAARNNISTEELVQRAILNYVAFDNLVKQGGNLEVTFKKSDGTTETKDIAWN